MPLMWTKGTDDDDNDLYEANSCLNDDGSAFHWVVAPTFTRNRVRWTLYKSDSELVDGDDAMLEFLSAKTAKAWCERREAELLAKA